MTKDQADQTGPDEIAYILTPDEMDLIQTQVMSAKTLLRLCLHKPKAPDHITRIKAALECLEQIPQSEDGDYEVASDQVAEYLAANPVFREYSGANRLRVLSHSYSIAAEWVQRRFNIHPKDPRIVIITKPEQLRGHPPAHFLVAGSPSPDLLKVAEFREMVEIEPETAAQRLGIEFK